MACECVGLGQRVRPLKARRLQSSRVLSLALQERTPPGSPLRARPPVARAGATASAQYAGSAVWVSRKAAPVSTALYCLRSMEYLQVQWAVQAVRCQHGNHSGRSINTRAAACR